MIYQHHVNAKELPIRAKQGDTFVMSFTPRFNPYTPKDLTGATGLLQVRDTRDVSRILFTFHPDDLTLLFDAGNAPPTPTTPGREPAIIASATAFTTQAWDWQHARYDLQVTYASGVTLTEFTGDFTIEKDYAYV